MGPAEAALVQKYDHIHEDLVTGRPREQVLIREPVLRGLRWDVKNLTTENDKLQAINKGLRLEIALLSKKLDRFRFSLLVQVDKKSGSAPKLSTELPTEKMPPTIKYILDLVSYNEKIPVNDILSPRRNSKNIRARQFVYHLSRMCTPKSYPAIGKEIGGRDHTTVLCGLRKITKLYRSDPEVRTRLDWYEQLLTENPNGAAI